MRSDARVNHDRVVATARQTFAELGPDARVEEIARRAGVGVGTVYRHFPAKVDLVRAILEEHIDGLLERFDPESDTAALDGFMRAIVELEAQDRGVISLMAQSLGPAARPANLDALYARVWALIRKGQRDGVLRAGIQRSDVPALLRMATGAVGDSSEQASAATRRRLRFLLDGLAG
jgi:AcrR family transcriptional regulator